MTRGAPTTMVSPKLTTGTGAVMNRDEDYRQVNVVP